jgi:IS5 family transposase
LVRDRLRLKDASHVIANIAVPSTLALVAQIRDKLLAAAEPFDPLRVEGERINLELLRTSSKGQPDQQRLLARVTHLRELLAWIDELPEPEEAPRNAPRNAPWQRLLQRRQLAHKILSDQDHPQDGDKTRSTVDPDARRGKHGDWYDGYLLDVLMDADSELITQTNVLAANADEAQDALELIRREEARHGNDIQSLSIDGAGFNGPLLRELQDPEGLAVETFVPPKKTPAAKFYTPEDFVEDAQHGRVTCPAGQTSLYYRQRDGRDRGWIYRFQKKTCTHCPLLSQCMSHPPKGHFGKTVRKSDYQEEFQRVRQKATTQAYTAIRLEHPKVERKLGEVLNRHGGRRADYRGIAKVQIHQLLACTAANIKRIVNLLCAKKPALAGI